MKSWLIEAAPKIIFDMLYRFLNRTGSARILKFGLGWDKLATAIAWLEIEKFILWAQNIKSHLCKRWL
jgi:hypothetical protein